MARFVVRNCCFCFSLRSGSYIIAVLALIFNLILIVNDAYNAITKQRSYLWIGVAIYFIGMLLAVMLFYGTRNDKKVMIWAWVWINGFILSLTLIYIIICLSLLWLSVLNSFFAFLVLVIEIYFLLVVRSFAIYLGEETLLPGTVSPESPPYSG